jgi:hypothetical protein
MGLAVTRDCLESAGPSVFEDHKPRKKEYCSLHGSKVMEIGTQRLNAIDQVLL